MRTSIDYDPKAEISIQFFKKVQNKIHYAIHGQTAAEVIYTRADAEKEFMGLTTFAGSQPTLKEAVVAKNYLNEKELRAHGTACFRIFGFRRTAGRTGTDYDHEGLG